jgi:hypothetical protein
MGASRKAGAERSPDTEYHVRIRTPLQPSASDRSRTRLALILAVLAGLVFASFFASRFTSRAEAAEGSGKITGKVTSASTEAPIAGIEVCAFPKSGGEGPIETGENGEGGEEAFLKCPTTAANGEYTISGLASGEYIVTFGPPFLSELNYVGQFYDGKSSFTEATPVPLATGATASGIDAKLAEGGRIAGRVTSSATGAAIGGTIVCAVSGANPEIGGCALTNASGEYTIAGLSAGEYKVLFAAQEYAAQVYDGKSALSEATSVSVLVGSTTSGIDAALTPKPPAPPGGTTTVPSTPGAPTGPAKSKGPTPRVEVASKGVIKPGRSRLVHVKLACSGARCHGSVELTEQVVDRRLEGTRVVLSPETLVLARGSFSLAAGKSARIALRLTAAGRKRLSRPRRHLLAAQLALSVTGGATSVQSVRAG